MSDTPRTNEAEKKSDRSVAEYNYSYGFDYIGGLEIFALDGWEFARELELETQKLRRDYVELKKFAIHLQKYLDNQESSDEKEMLNDNSFARKSAFADTVSWFIGVSAAMLVLMSVALVTNKINSECEPKADEVASVYIQQLEGEQ